MWIHEEGKMLLYLYPKVMLWTWEPIS
jgi:hypothetical protein